MSTTHPALELGLGVQSPAQEEGEYTVGEEVAHAITHGVGALLALAALVVLVAHAALYGTVSHVVGCSVFGATLVLLYLASTLYHAMPPRSLRAKRVLQQLDHGAIYLLIAGTYTPFTLVALSGGWAVGVFAAIWGLALVGLVVTATPLRRFRRFSLALYLAMGWLGVVAARPLVHALPWAAILLVVAGGLAYTVGVIFYARDRKWSHAVWHGFVLAGSALHFFAVLALVLP